MSLSEKKKEKLGEIKLSKWEAECFKLILADLKTRGKSDRCPWKRQALLAARCMQDLTHPCRKLFPKGASRKICPCDIYSPDYLIRCVTYLLNSQESRLRKENPS